MLESASLRWIQTLSLTELTLLDGPQVGGLVQWGVLIAFIELHTEVLERLIMHIVLCSLMSDQVKSNDLHKYQSRNLAVLILQGSFIATCGAPAPFASYESQCLLEVPVTLLNRMPTFPTSRWHIESLSLFP